MNLNNYQPKLSQANSERSFIIEQFVKELNKERGGKWKKLDPKVVAIKLSHIKNLQHLYKFLSQCRDYKNRHGSFGKYFFGALKIK